MKSRCVKCYVTVGPSEARETRAYLCFLCRQVLSNQQIGRWLSEITSAD